MKERNGCAGIFGWALLIALIIMLNSCVTRQPVHYTVVRIIKVDSTDKGYWVHFRDRIGLYKSFQEQRPDSIYPGKLMRLPKVYRVNRSL